MSQMIGRDPVCIWPVEAELGEGPCWSAAEGALWFVDIKGQRIHRFHYESRVKQTWAARDKVSFILPDDRGTYVVGLPDAVERFTPENAQFERLVDIEHDHPHNRLNDACVDSLGRVWFGSMDDQERVTTGALYCWDGASTPVRQDEGYLVPNGPAFSPDGRYLYHTSTTHRVIYRFDVDRGGTIQGKQAFIQIEEEAGWPDGSAVDAEGCLWVALWRGWAVRRYSPAGALLRTVSLPCANVTKVAFGGPDLKIAFVTTARAGLSPEEHDAQPLAGGLFAFRVDVPGWPQHVVATGAPP